MSADHVCQVIYDADGKPIARARVAEDATDEDIAAVAAIVQAAVRYQEQLDAADPEGAAERASRQVKALTRIREQSQRRSRGED